MSYDQLWHQIHLHADANVEARLEDLEHRLAKMSLINQALWEILRRENELRDDEILSKVAEIDLRDGTLDEHMNKGPIHCPSCGRKTSRRQRRCIYCSAEIPEDLFT